MKKHCLLVCLLLLGSLGASAQSGALTFGPTLHLNLGDKLALSGGFEVAYWNLEKVPAGLDLGVDFQKSRQRFYLEGQIGIGLAGIAVGPVLEKQREAPLALGWQSNLWANYFAGLNLRWRRINGEKTFATGIYAKYPLLLGYDESSSGNSSWGDFWDD